MEGNLYLLSAQFGLRSGIPDVMQPFFYYGQFMQQALACASRKHVIVYTILGSMVYFPGVVLSSRLKYR